MIDVLVQGRPSVDLTFLGLSELPRLGEEYQATGFAMNPGACFINVHALCRLGLRTGFATDLGNDFFSRYILDRLRAAGIDETFIRFQERDLAEISVGLSFPHERTFITWDAGRDWTTRPVLPDDLRTYRVRCLFTYAPFDPEVHAEARCQGIPICVDSSWNPAFLTSPAMQRAIDQATAFLPNLAEAQRITGRSGAAQALEALRDRCPMVAIKLGAEGAIGSYQGRTYRVPALPVPCIDTTGAGDNFDAGFIYGLLGGLPFAECLRCAVVAGSLSTIHPGGVAGSPTEGELLHALARLGPATVSAPGQDPIPTED